MLQFRKEMGPIGGEGMHVELDETFLKRKYARGRSTWFEKEGFKIFGGICRETKAFFTLVVPNLTKEALWPMIYEYVAPKSIVYTDSAAVYSSLCKESGRDFGFEFRNHEAVNHSVGEFTRRSIFETDSDRLGARIDSTSATYSGSSICTTCSSSSSRPLLWSGGAGTGSLSQ